MVGLGVYIEHIFNVKHINNDLCFNVQSNTDANVYLDSNTYLNQNSEKTIPYYKNANYSDLQ